MKRNYDEAYLRGLLSKYANERIESLECVNEGIKIIFKPGYATALNKGPAYSQLYVENLSVMKTICKKEYLDRGAKRLKEQPNEKDIVYFKCHHEMALSEAKDLLEKAKEDWLNSESYQRKAERLQKKAISLKLLLMKETQEPINSKSWTEMIAAIENGVYGNEISFYKEKPEIEGSDFFIQTIFSDETKSLESVAWWEDLWWVNNKNYEELEFENFSDVLKYARNLNKNNKTSH